MVTEEITKDLRSSLKENMVHKDWRLWKWNVEPSCFEKLWMIVQLIKPGDVAFIFECTVLLLCLTKMWWSVCSKITYISSSLLFILWSSISHFPTEGEFSWLQAEQPWVGLSVVPKPVCFCHYHIPHTNISLWEKNWRVRLHINRQLLNSFLTSSPFALTDSAQWFLQRALTEVIHVQPPARSSDYLLTGSLESMEGSLLNQPWSL